MPQEVAGAAAHPLNLNLEYNEELQDAIIMP